MHVKKETLLRDGDIKIIANIHKRNYPKGHLTSNFNESLLFEYYKIICQMSDSIVIARDNDGIIVGFAFVGKNFANLMQNFFKANKFAIIKFSMLNAFCVLAFFFAKFLNKTKYFKSSSTIRLLSIVTEQQGTAVRGVGTKIINFICQDVCKEEIVGLSVKVSNLNALNFYIRNGFLIEEIIKDKAFMVKR
ncbi:N-acetyltransferase [Vibrio harveyi]